jgi:putative ABC transport system substrate-binding protein
LLFSFHGEGRRDFITIVGGAALAWPFAVPAQSQIPVIGYINSRSPSDSADIVATFRQGLKEAGFVDGQNVMIRSRFAESDFARLPDLAADLAQDRVDVLVATGGTVSVVKVKPVVPQTIPIVFAMGGDPVKLGVVASLNRPEANITGVAFLVNGLASKQIELLHALVPKAAVMAFLVNPKDPNAQTDISDARAAASSLGQKLVIGEASTKSELDAIFRNFSQQQVEAVFVDAEPFLLDQHKTIISLAAQRASPVVSQFRSVAADEALAFLRNEPY